MIELLMVILTMIGVGALALIALVLLLGAADEHGDWDMDGVWRRR